MIRQPKCHPPIENVQNDQSLVLYPQIFLIFGGLLKYVKGLYNAIFLAQTARI